MVINNNT